MTPNPASRPRRVFAIGHGWIATNQPAPLSAEPRSEPHGFTYYFDTQELTEAAVRQLLEQGWTDAAEFLS